MITIRALAVICAMVWSSVGSAVGLRAFAGGAPPAGRCLSQAIVYEPVHAGSFAAVSAPSPTDIRAVGTDESKVPHIPLIVHWDGRHWQRIPFPLGRRVALLRSIAVLSDHDVWVAGYVWPSSDTNIPGVSLVARWDGVRWRDVPGGDAVSVGAPTGMVVLSPDDAWIIGASLLGGGDLIVNWDGRRWHAFEYPGSHIGDTLAAIAAGSARDIWAVGADWIGHTLTVHWDGRRWQRVPSPDAPLGQAENPDTQLRSVAADASGDAWAGGSGGDNIITPVHSFLMRWDGGAWQAVPGARALARTMGFGRWLWSPATRLGRTLVAYWSAGTGGAG